MNCACRLNSCGPVVARWIHSNSNVSHLCQGCLDAWLDNADDDPELEPTTWQWLDIARLHQETPADHLTHATSCT